MFVFLVSAGGVSFIAMSMATAEAAGADHTIAMITEARLSDQHGDLIKKSDLENKLVLMNFFFTGCEGACPLQTAVVRDVRDELSVKNESPDVVYLSVSIAPYSDTKEAIKKYISHYKLDQSSNTNNWKFSTTDVEKLQKLIERFGVTVDNAVLSDGEFDHRNIGYLFGKSGNLMQQYQLVPGITKRLTREIVELDSLHL